MQYSRSSWLAQVAGLPSGNPHLERLSGLSRQAPHLKPLVFDLLLHRPLLSFCEPSAGDPSVVHPCVLSVGGHGPVHVVLSAAAHLAPFAQRQLNGSGPQRCTLQAYDSGIDWLAQLLPVMHEPLVVDLLQPHAVLLEAEEARAWLAAWRSAPAPVRPLRDGRCVCEPAAGAPVLLDRLAAYLGCWPAVERAYLMRTGPCSAPSPELQVTLVLKCDDADAVARIERALPLLNYELPAGQPPVSALLWIDRHPMFERVVQALQPIYSLQPASTAVMKRTAATAPGRGDGDAWPAAAGQHARRDSRRS
jgi:hypothetical protein